MNLRRAIGLLAALLAVPASGSAQNKQLTIDDIFDPARRVDFNGTVPQVRWLPDGKSYLLANADPRKGATGFRRVDATSGKDEPFLDAAKLERALAATTGVTAADAKALAASTDFTFDDAFDTLVFDYGEDLYAYDVPASRVTRLTSAPGEENDVAFSPNGRMVAYTREGNLYVSDVATGRERALTTDGDALHLNGRLDWVYEEEIYGRGDKGAFWWSPDSSSVAYLSLDESVVPAWGIPDDIPQDQNLEIQHYPQVGDPNPGVRLGVVAAAGGPTSWVALTGYDPPDTLVTRVGWAPDGKRLYYEVQDRVQSWLDLNSVEPGGGAPTRLFRETTKAWVEAVAPPAWLPDGTFLWQSDRTGFRHVYHYAADGKLLGAVTSGEWDVRDVYGAADGWVYVSAAEHSPTADHVYRVKLDGTGLARLTDVEGDHRAMFNPQYTRFFDMSSTISTPPQMRLRDAATGKIVRVLEENRVAALAEYKLGTPEFVRVPARDGFVMEAVMIKPPDFDPSKKYPVMEYTYAGPGAQSARDSWGRQTYLWHQLLAQHGYIVWILDNRQASAKGVRSAWTSFHNFGEPELRDIEDGVSWLKKQPYVDGDRIGIWGWSFGGYMTSYTLTHSTSFKIGIAGAPVTDWHNYDSIYTERYMGLPGDNREGYERSSVVRAAANLHGKLLLVHGSVDDNVHTQNSIQFVDALEKAGKQFRYMVYPQSRHGVTNPLRVKHLRAMMADFVFENL